MINANWPESPDYDMLDGLIRLTLLIVLKSAVSLDSQKSVMRDLLLQSDHDTKGRSLDTI